MLPLDILINAILSSKGIRNMMIQYIDYGEHEEHCPITTKYLQEIKLLFPTLYQSHVFLGVICSLQPYTDNDLIDNETVGKILGYPCCEDYNKSHEISFHVNVRSTDDMQYQLFANVACDRSKEEHFVKFVEIANMTINDNLHIDSRLEKNCIYYCVNFDYSSETIIKSLITNTFNSDYVESLRNILGNLFSYSRDILEHVDFTNQKHIGILIGLLATDIHNPVEHFYPLPIYNKDDVKATMNAWGDKIVCCLDQTKRH